MAAELAFSLFKTSLPHPLVLIKFGAYRLTKFSDN